MTWQFTASDLPAVMIFSKWIGNSYVLATLFCGRFALPLQICKAFYAKSIYIDYIRF